MISRSPCRLPTATRQPSRVGLQAIRKACPTPRKARSNRASTRRCCGRWRLAATRTSRRSRGARGGSSSTPREHSRSPSRAAIRTASPARLRRRSAARSPPRRCANSTGRRCAATALSRSTTPRTSSPKPATTSARPRARSSAGRRQAISKVPTSHNSSGSRSPTIRGNSTCATAPVPPELRREHSAQKWYFPDVVSPVKHGALLNRNAHRQGRQQSPSPVQYYLREGAS
jgi:hypothetical protein